MFRTRPFLWTALLALSAVGCGNSVPRADRDRARDAVQACLTAWQNGQAADSITLGSAPIAFRDDAYQAGQRLISFEIVDVQPHPDKPLLLCTVRAVLEDRAGKQGQREIFYRVQLAPTLAVGRDPYY